MNAWDNVKVDPKGLKPEDFSKVISDPPFSQFPDPAPQEDKDE